MRNYHNIEKSGFRAGQYVGYAGGVWRIKKYGNGARAWRACRTQGEHKVIFARTLRELSAKLGAEEGA